MAGKHIQPSVLQTCQVLYMLFAFVCFSFSLLCVPSNSLLIILQSTLYTGTHDLLIISNFGYVRCVFWFNVRILSIFFWLFICLHARLLVIPFYKFSFCFFSVEFIFLYAFVLLKLCIIPSKTE